VPFPANPHSIDAVLLDRIGAPWTIVGYYRSWSKKVSIRKILLHRRHGRYYQCNADGAAHCKTQDAEIKRKGISATVASRPSSRTALYTVADAQLQYHD